MATSKTLHRGKSRESEDFLKNLPLRLLAPVPLSLFQPILRRIARKLSRERPELFQRLGIQKEKRFIINPSNLPFAFLLCPHPRKPLLTACHRAPFPEHDARITGSFLTLLDMIDGRLDGDALFFSRHLAIEGDVEAVVALRNALDGMVGNITDDLASSLGFPAKIALATARHIGKRRPANG